MKGWKTSLAVPAALAALAVAAAPATAPASPTAARKPAHAFTHYVACVPPKGTLSKRARPTHACLKRRKKGAFFRSNVGDVSYSVCVRFPSGRRLCARHQEAKQGTLYVNKVTSNIPGRHAVSWYVHGKRVGLWRFLVLRHPPRHRRAGK